LAAAADCIGKQLIPTNNPKVFTIIGGDKDDVARILRETSLSVVLVEC
jgi:hypothetical protein